MGGRGVDKQTVGKVDGGAMLQSWNVDCKDGKLVMGGIPGKTWKDVFFF